MVTPSFVIVGAPHFLSSTPLRPFGPSVIETASASLLTPASRDRLASSSNFSSLAATWTDLLRFPSEAGTPVPAVAPPDLGPPPRSPSRALLLDDGQHVPAGQDEVLVALDLDLGAAVLRVDDLVADLDVEGDPLPVLPPTRADGHDLALLGLLLGRVGDHDPRGRGLLLLAGPAH